MGIDIKQLLHGFRKMADAHMQETPVDGSLFCFSFVRFRFTEVKKTGWLSASMHHHAYIQDDIC